jgi:hypothetical protein
MKNYFLILFILTIHLSSYAFSSNPGLKTRTVLWYKAKSNKYPVYECKPGPCLDKDSKILEGMIATGTVAQHSGSSGPHFVIGSGLNDKQGRCGFVWSRDLNSCSGTVTSAKFRAEYRDGNGWCNGGPIAVRCGVVDYRSDLDFWGGVDKVPEMAEWQDYLNPLNNSMGFNWQSPDNNGDGERDLMAEEIIHIRAPAGRPGKSSASVLDGQFFEIDITDQTNWILSNQGQFAIVFLVPPNEGNTGKANTYSSENQEMPGGSDNPWTTDGNTVHIVLEGSLSFDN